MSEVLADIELVKRLVVEAGKLAEERRGSVACELKQDESLVTAVDRETEEFLAQELSRAYPGYAFLGEEYGWRGPRDAPLWACDPIDGTTNYVFGLPHWCVSVGLLHQGVPQLGALYVPRLDELFWAVRGEGAFCNGARLQPPARDRLHAEDTLSFSSQALKTLDTSRVIGAIRGIGSVATEIAYTARGNLCATLGQGERILDVAAALCLLFEVGGELRHLSSGEPVDIIAYTEAYARPYDPAMDHLVYAAPEVFRCLREVLAPRGAAA